MRLRGGAGAWGGKWGGKWGEASRAANTQCPNPVAPGKKNADHEMTGASLAGGTQESWSYPKNQGLTTKEKEREPMPSGAGGKGGKGESGKGKGKDGGKGKGKGKGKAGKGKGKGHGMTHGKPQVVGDGVRGKISGPNKGVIKVAPKRAVDSARPSWLD